MSDSHTRPFSLRGYDVIYTAVPAIGRDPFPPARRSRISPPEPVAAPLNGSTVVGKLCVSAFIDMTESISLISYSEGTSPAPGANCSAFGPSINATLSLYGRNEQFVRASDVRFISLKRDVSFFTPSITNVPLNILVAAMLGVDL